MTEPQQAPPGSTWREQASLALRQAVAKVIAQHKRAALPLAVWRGDRVEWISADEAEAELIERPPHDPPPGQLPTISPVR